MSLGLLGEGFDLHAGGLDLKFPHHENERAQAVALGQRFAEHWMHHAFVVDRTGEKMSKSLGNYENLLDFTEQHDPRSFRLMLLQAHYRSPVSMDAELAGAAERTLAGLDAFARRAASVGAAEPDADVLARFRDRMDDDLDTPGAMAIVFDTVRRANAAIDRGADAAALVAAVREMTGAVGLELGGVDEVPAEVAERVAALDAARAAKDFAAADAIRAELQADGWTVETTATGTTVHR
jgi:cysteinyl-tRNA synthetase